MFTSSTHIARTRVRQCVAGVRPRRRVGAHAPSCTLLMHRTPRSPLPRLTGGPDSLFDVVRPASTSLKARRGPRDNLPDASRSTARAHGRPAPSHDPALVLPIHIHIHIPIHIHIHIHIHIIPHLSPPRPRPKPPGPAVKRDPERARAPASPERAPSKPRLHWATIPRVLHTYSAHLRANVPTCRPADQPTSRAWARRGRGRVPFHVGVDRLSKVHYYYYYYYY
ncbi:hypothetical protein BC628DRAFT_1040172 [Trametes gibbosa]|nr:hypothetical protein BC628DRAFT_1040172 [Trametes gibbosa]